MRKIERAEIVDFQTWADGRAAALPAALAAKEVRRADVGGVLTFLFENRATVRWQIQEMMRVERIVREADVQHEIDTYNELLGGPGALGCTLLIGIADPAERDRKLRAWRGLLAHVWVRTPDDRRVYPTFDARQVGEERLSSVQYLEFAVGARAPVAVGVDLPELAAETSLSEATRAALQADLDETADV
jgi:hypothetical protein